MRLTFLLKRNGWIVKYRPLNGLSCMMGNYYITVLRGRRAVRPLATRCNSDIRTFQVRIHANESSELEAGHCLLLLPHVAVSHLSRDPSMILQSNFNGSPYAVWKSIEIPIPPLLTKRYFIHSAISVVYLLIMMPP